MEEKKFNFDEIMKLAPKGNGATGKSQSLYRKEIFEGMTSKQCKSKRSELRRKRDNFIEAAISCKSDKKALESLKENWKIYSEAIYKDVKNICEANSSEQTQKLCANFLAVMNAK